jgi:hypothetical protein
MLSLKQALTSAVLVATFSFGPQLARASFIYNVLPMDTAYNFGNSQLVVTAYNNSSDSPTLSGMQYINLAQVTLTSSTSASAPDTKSIPISLNVGIENHETAAYDTIVLTGTINVLRADAEGAVSTFALSDFSPASLTLGDYVYTLSNPVYAPPTIGAGSSGNGALSVVITETRVPEPASLSVLALGAVALLARRRK